MTRLATIAWRITLPVCWSLNSGSTFKYSSLKRYHPRFKSKMSDELAISAKKKILRESLRTSLAEMDDGKILESSRLVAEQLFSLPQFKTSRGLACFVSMPKEFNSMPILQGIFREGKTCYLPRVESLKERRMALLKTNTLEEIATWPKSKWNIPEPPRDEVARLEALDDAADVDIVVVPGLAFDNNGGRLGQGAGFYDRYLAQLLAKRRAAGLPIPMLIGVTLDELMLDDVPRDQYDLAMDLVLYPSRK